MALPRTFYASAPKQYPQRSFFVIAHTSKQIQFNGRKGHKEVVTAINLLKQKGIDIRVRFAGSDYDNGIEKIHQYARLLGVDDKIEFVGYLDKLDLSLFLETSDLFVLPTKAEGLPRVIIEAMAKALPCISTKVSGNRELLDDIYLIENFYDVETLASCIENVIKNRNVYESVSKKNLEKSREYEASLLQQRRDLFYLNLKNCAKKRNNL